MRILHTIKTKGYKTLNKLLQKATGEYICIIASDDKYLPDFDNALTKMS